MGHVFIIKRSPYGIQVYLIGLIMVAIFYGIRYAYKDKSIKDTLKVIMVITYTLIALLSVLNYNNLTFIIVVSLISGFNWFILFQLPYSGASEFFGLSFSSFGFIREYRFYPKIEK